MSTCLSCHDSVHEHLSSLIYIHALSSPTSIVMVNVLTSTSGQSCLFSRYTALLSQHRSPTVGCSIPAMTVILHKLWLANVRLSGSIETTDVRPHGPSVSSDVRPYGSTVSSDAKPSGSTGLSDVRPLYTVTSDVKPGALSNLNTRPVFSRLLPWTYCLHASVTSCLSASDHLIALWLRI